jgi:hypothetical protein
MAGTKDIVIEQGATFSLPVVWKDSAGDPIDLTGWSARMQIRKSKRATDVLHEATSTGGDIVLGDAAGTIVVTIEATDTAAFTWKRGVYDLELIDGTTVYRLLEGAVEVSPEVTR